MSTQNKRYYAIARGHKTGIFTRWDGADKGQAQVKGFKNALYRGFYTRAEAEEWLRENTTGKNPIPSSDSNSDPVVIYTDGGAINNPGPGGYGAVLLYKNKRKEISKGYRQTTNNRMELLACIKALQCFKERKSIIIYTDSMYLVNGITKGWAKKWQKNKWMRNLTDRAENIDLWSKLLELTGFHQVSFQWIRGHAGIPENEHCDQLVKKAIDQKKLLPDLNYQKKQTQSTNFNF